MFLSMQQPSLNPPSQSTLSERIVDVAEGLYRNATADGAGPLDMLLAGAIIACLRCIAILHQRFLAGLDSATSPVARQDAEPHKDLAPPGSAAAAAPARGTPRQPTRPSRSRRNRPVSTRTGRHRRAALPSSAGGRPHIIPRRAFRPPVRPVVAAAARRLFRRSC